MSQCRKIRVIQHTVEWKPKLKPLSSFEKSAFFTYNNAEFCLKICKRVIIGQTPYPSHHKCNVWEFKVCLERGAEQLDSPFDVEVSIFNDNIKSYTSPKQTFDDDLLFLSWILPESKLGEHPDIKPLEIENNRHDWNTNFDHHFHLQVTFSSCNSPCHPVHVEGLSRKRPRLDKDKIPSCSKTQACLQSLSSDLMKLFKNRLSDPDVVLKCSGGYAVSAHKIILSSRSDVFKAMLRTDMVESRSHSIEIAEMNPSVLELFVEYMYTGIVRELNEEIASELYDAADKYAVTALKKRCAGFLNDRLTHENSCELLCLADAHSDKKFKEDIIYFMVENEVPLRFSGWHKFCNSNPKLANEVLISAYKDAKFQE